MPKVSVKYWPKGKKSLPSGARDNRGHHNYKHYLFREDYHAFNEAVIYKDCFTGANNFRWSERSEYDDSFGRVFSIHAQPGPVEVGSEKWGDRVFSDGTGAKVWQVSEFTTDEPYGTEGVKSGWFIGYMYLANEGQFDISITNGAETYHLFRALNGVAQYRRGEVYQGKEYGNAYWTDKLPTMFSGFTLFGVKIAPYRAVFKNQWAAVGYIKIPRGRWRVMMTCRTSIPMKRPHQIAMTQIFSSHGVRDNERRSHTDWEHVYNQESLGSLLHDY